MHRFWFSSLLMVAACSPAIRSNPDDFRLNTKDTGFLTQDMYQMSCAATGDATAPLIRAMLVENCRRAVVIGLASHKFRLEQVRFRRISFKNDRIPDPVEPDWSACDQILLWHFSELLPGRIVAETYNGDQIKAMYRLERPGLYKTVNDSLKVPECHQDTIPGNR